MAFFEFADGLITRVTDFWPEALRTAIRGVSTSSSAGNPARFGTYGGMMTLIARFQVDGYEPRQVTGAFDADWFGLMTFREDLHLRDHRARHHAVHGRGQPGKDPGRTWPPNGSPGAPAAGEEGSVTVQHGRPSSPIPISGSATSCRNTGTGGFAGWSGSARIRHDDQGAYFEIELS